MKNKQLVIIAVGIVIVLAVSYYFTQLREEVVSETATSTAEVVDQSLLTESLYNKGLNDGYEFFKNELMATANLCVPYTITEEDKVEQFLTINCVRQQLQATSTPQ